MVRTRPWAKAAWIILTAMLASASLMLPLEARDQGRAGMVFPLVKYADGRHIFQVYFHPPQDRIAAPVLGPVSVNAIQSVCERQAPLGESCFRLRPKLVTRLRARVASLAHGVSRNASLPVVSEKLAVFDFDLYCDDLPVAKACRTVLVHEGRPVAIRDRNPPIGLAKPKLPMQVIAENTAWAVVGENARATVARLYPGKAPHLVVGRETPGDPSARVVLWPDQQNQQLYPAWTMTVRSTAKAQPFLRRYWVDASTPGRILDFEDLIFYQAPVERGPSTVDRGPLRLDRSLLAPSPMPFAQPPAAVDPKSDPKTENGITAVFPGAVTGTVTGTMWETSPYRRTVTRPLPSIEISVSRSVGSQAMTSTDESGHYTLSGVNGLATIRAVLSGPGCKIFDDQAGPKNDDFARYSHDVGRANVDVDYFPGTTEESKLAQTSAYYHVNRAFEFVKPFLPENPSKLPRLPTHVNLDSSCNAYYDRSDGTLNFFQATPGAGPKGCPNTAYRDVVFHEYGHAVDDELGGILDGAYSEGFGDSLAMLLTRSPIVGQDFYGLGQHLRDSSKVVSWPRVKDGEIHDAGQAYAGFSWELAQRLQQIYDPDRAYEVAKQLIMGAAVQNPKDIPDAVRLSFFVDAKLFPGPTGSDSMHAAQLRAAARSRDLPVPRDLTNLSSPAY